jgi:AraC family transcriptional regulator, regulatory protein of adaptative response / methylated-DNA-[protein]-cysteine methyltransferase
MSRSAGLLIVRLKFMTFIETSERTNVTVALRDQPNTGGDASDELIRFAIGECSLGSTLAAVTDKGICAILLGDNSRILRRELPEHFKAARLIESDQDLRQLMAKVVQLVESPWLGVDLTFDLRGTSFERRVWQALRKIPAGSTASYTDIAERVGEPTKAFAVAEACAANMLAVAIPCHRVVRKSGALAGYRWGFKRKRALLDREAAHYRGVGGFYFMRAGAPVHISGASVSGRSSIGNKVLPSGRDNDAT